MKTNFSGLHSPPKQRKVPSVFLEMDFLHGGANTINGGAKLPLCPDFTGSERSDAGGNTRENIAALVLVEIWANRQVCPTIEEIHFEK